MIRWFYCKDCKARYSRCFDGAARDDKHCRFCGSKRIKRLFRKNMLKELGLKDVDKL